MTPEDYARLGARVWTVFGCSALASQAHNRKERERLFMLGYNDGHKFIQTLSQGKIKNEDLNHYTPAVVLLSLQGPTDDFMLGTMYEHALKPMPDNPSEWPVGGATEFWRRNCNLIAQ
jgi:hypothetical protein